VASANGKVGKHERDNGSLPSGSDSGTSWAKHPGRGCERLCRREVHLAIRGARIARRCAGPAATLSRNSRTSSPGDQRQPRESVVPISIPISVDQCGARRARCRRSGTRADSRRGAWPSRRRIRKQTLRRMRRPVSLASRKVPCRRARFLRGGAGPCSPAASQRTIHRSERYTEANHHRTACCARNSSARPSA
jgi:hypothetical protein